MALQGISRDPSDRAVPGDEGTGHRGSERIRPEQYALGHAEESPSRDRTPLSDIDQSLLEQVDRASASAKPHNRRSPGKSPPEMSCRVDTEARVDYGTRRPMT